MRYSLVTIQAVSYRIIVIIVDAIALFLLFGNLWQMSIIVLLRHLIQTVIYWFHEAIWLRSNWGVTERGSSHTRTLVKTLTFRFIASAKDIVLIYALTENALVAAEGTIVITVLNTIVYYLHDRYWHAKKVVTPPDLVSGI